MSQLVGELLYLLLGTSCCFAFTVFGLWTLAPRPAKLADAHWHKRAHLLWPGRVFSNYSALALPTVFIGSLTAFRDTSPMVHPLIFWFLCFFAAVHASFAMRQRYQLPALRYCEYWRRWFCEVLILSTPYLITVVSIFVSEDHWTTTSTIQLVILLALFLAHAFGVSLFLTKKLGWAKPGLHPFVEPLAQAANIPAPPTFILQLLTANALAFPFSRQLGFGDRLVHELSDEEISAVCRHEIAHLTEPALVKISRLSFISFLLPLAMIGPIIGTFGLPVWLVLYLIAVVILAQFNKLSRKMEDRADSHGARTPNSDHEYACALERLYEMNLIPAVLKKRNLTHPDLYDRLARVGAPPSYPRPAPPQVWRAMLMILTCAAATILLARYYWAKI
jgi:Zn-dependent protease with chaperone function